MNSEEVREYVEHGRKFWGEFFDGYFDLLRDAACAAKAKERPRDGAPINPVATNPPAKD